MQHQPLAHTDEKLLSGMRAFGETPLTIHVELDRTSKTFSDMLDWKVGSQITLSRPTDENVDIYVGNVLIGWGEILMIDGTMAIRIAEVRNDAPKKDSGV